MWACLLDKDSKEFEWLAEDPTKAKNEDESEELKPSHRLLIKNAILMPEAEKDDVNVVQIECEGYNKKKVFLRKTVKLYDLVTLTFSNLGGSPGGGDERAGGLSEVRGPPGSSAS